MQRNGFTLIELMIVIAVMALLAGVVVMTVGSSGGPTESATRFAGRLAAARDQAILTGRPISAWISPSGYGFDQLRGGHWEPMTAKPFDGTDWGSGMQLNLTATAASRSRVRFDSLGMADQPLAMTLTRAGRSAGVRVAATGEVTVQ